MPLLIVLNGLLAKIALHLGELFNGHIRPILE
jgi:hypothetical protein